MSSPFLKLEGGDTGFGNILACVHDQSVTAIAAPLVPADGDSASKLIGKISSSNSGLASSSVTNAAAPGGYVPLGDEFAVNTTVIGRQISPEVVTLADGGFLIVWLDEANGAWLLSGQRFDATGQPIGGEIPLSQSDASGDHSVTALDNGGFIVTWGSFDPTESFSDLYARRFDATGALATDAFLVTTGTTSTNEKSPSVVQLENGNFVISWTSNAADWATSTIAARLFDANGTALGDVALGGPGANALDSVVLASRAGGAFVAVWSDSADGNVHARLYDASGAPTGASFVVNTTLDLAQYQPSVAALADGGFVVAWTSRGPIDPLLTDVYAQRYNSAGAAVGPEFLVNTVTDQNQVEPRVSALAGGGFAISWTGRDASFSGVMGQTFDAVGNATGGEFAVNSYTTGSQQLSTIAMLSGGRFVVAWDSNGQDGSSRGIFARIFTANAASPNEDWLTGTQGDDTIDALAGDDYILGLGGNDILIGGLGNDVLDGGDGGDDLFAGERGDGYLPFSINFPEFYRGPTLDRGSDVDSVSGGAGDDFISVGYGDSADGGAHGEIGDELFISMAAAPTGVQLDFRASTLTVGGGTITGFERVNYVEGSQFADVIVFDVSPFPLFPAFGGPGGGREISALAGDDQITAGYYTENIWGGDGNDRLDGSASQYLGYLDGGSGSDTLIGNRHATKFNGGEGSDTITGGASGDTLTGGSGSDTFLDSAANLNGDTITDLRAGDRIVISDANLANFTYSLNGNTLTYTGGSLTLGGLPAGRLVATAAAGGGVQLAIAVDTRHDFNGDGRSDLAGLNTNGTFTTWQGQANGSLAANPGSGANALGTSWRIAGSGDFNGDGRDDILWRHSSGEIGEWLGQWNGAFTNNGGAAANAVDNSWTVAGVADYNGDGRDDILWRHSSGEVGQWLGQPSGGFANNGGAAANRVDSSWTVTASGDFNGDGRADVLWRHTSGAFAEWQGTSTGALVNAGSVLAGASGSVVGSGDFNGDGRDDLLMRAANGAITAWLGQASGQFTSFTPTRQLLDSNWKIVAIGDYNGDGSDDLLWRHTSGEAGAWLATGTGDFANNGAIPTIDPSWQIQSPDIFLV